MNIFALDPDPNIAALLIPFPKPGIALIKESCQMLATNVSLMGGPTFLDWTHVNHPCTVWARETQANFNWLCEHVDSLQLCYEEKYKRTHAYTTLIFNLRTYSGLFPEGPLTEFVQAIPNRYRHSDPHVAYGRYLSEKNYLIQWSPKSR